LKDDNPSGESLRNDERFLELERLMQPQVEVVRNENNSPISQIIVPVDWAGVLRKAEALRLRGRDLTLLVIVTRALVNLRGLGGLTDGLTLIANTFNTYWETMHPELRPGSPPREAALRRINTLLQLQNNQDGLLKDLRQMTFFTPRGIGPITGLDLERGALDVRTVLNDAAPGQAAAEKAKMASAHEELLNRVRAGCAAQADQAGSEMTALRTDARAAAAALNDVKAALNTRLGEETDVILPDLTRFLERVLATLERAAASRSSTDLAGQPGDGAAPAPGPPSPNGAAILATPLHAGAVTAFPDRLASREDVMKCLDLIIAFYDQTEPSSPIPHLARRIRRMVPMDFLQLMEDLAPSGLKEFRLLAGVPENRKTAQKDER